MQIVQHIPSHHVLPQSARRSEMRSRDLLAPFMMMSAGVVLAIVVVSVVSAGMLAYPVGLVGGIAILPWIVSAIPVSSRYRASEQGFSALVMTIAVFVSFSGLYSGRMWAFAGGLLLLSISLTIWFVGRRFERV